MNLVGTDEAKKKDFRSDITEGKRTLVVVHALQNTEPAARERLVEILSSKERDPEVLAEAVAIMEKTGSIDYARTFAEDLALNAKAPAGPGRCLPRRIAICSYPWPTGL